MPSAALNDIDMHYEIRGEGEPLMLIAGLASDCQSWHPALADLARRCRVIAPDNRGVGRTTPQDAETSIRRMADDTVALIGLLGLRSVNLLGHSMGGFVALDVAARHADLVGSLILAGTSAATNRRNDRLFADWASSLESGTDAATWFRNVFYWIFSRRFFEAEDVLGQAIRLAVEYPYPQTVTAFRNQIDAIAGFDGSERLAQVRSSTLVITGEEDLLFPPADGARLAQAIPGARFTPIANAAHAIHVEQPRAFTDSVLSFLSER